MSRPYRISRLIQASFACIALAGAALPAAASYPERPISLVVPFAPGGVTDLVARVLSEGLSQQLGKPVIVENRPGAGTTLGANLVAKAKPDGYTLLLGVVHHTIASSVYKTLPYDFQKDLAPVSTVATVYNALTINPTATPVKSVDELVALAKRSPASLPYGSNGNGTLQHLIATLFQLQTGTELLHVPYKGSAPLTMALLAGEVNLSFDSIPPVLPSIQEGKLKALAVLGQQRNPQLPDVPTLAELGYDGFDFNTWNGVLAPAGTPPAVIETLSKALRTLIASPAFQKRMTDAGLVTLGSTPEEFAQKIADDTTKFASIVERGKIVIE